MSEKHYNEHSIQVKEGLEAVRIRPGMYIGDTGVDGLHHLIWEISDNSVDEHMEGYCNNIDLTINSDGSMTVIDDGRGIPVGIHPTEGVSAATVVFTVLHAGGKFDTASYKTSGGLHGVGASVTNALSEWLEVEIKRDNKIYFQRFERGVPVEDLKEIGTYDDNKTGTKVTFKPDSLIFKETTTFEDEKITTRLKELSFLNKGLKLTFKSEISDKKEKYLAKNGLVDYMKEVCLHPLYEPIHITQKYDFDKQTSLDIDLIMVHGSDFKGKTLSFANNIKTIEDGTHVIGTVNGFTKALMDKKDIFKVKESDSIKGENFKDGLYSIITIKLSNPEFRGQVKGKLNNQEARTGTYNVVKSFMDEWIDKNEKVVKEIIKKAIYAKKAVDAMNRAYDLIERKSDLGDGFLLPGKLTDCQSKNPQECELLIVEGESAGGCFSGDTKIKTTDNKNKTILEMKNDFDNGIDNFIYTYNKEFNQIEIQKVSNCWETKITNDLIYVTLDNNEKVLCTSDHKFMLKNGNYIEAKELKENDSLMPLNKNDYKVLKIEKYIGKELSVYDIEVPNTHNFALASGVFVHNSAKSARDRRTQAVLPLKGKPLNAHKNSLADVLKNDEIKSLIKAMGCGYKDNFDEEKLRYHKIIVMTDADVDGSHIQTLLLGLFFNYFPELIEKGYLYIAQPPLYFTTIKKNKFYILNDAELEKFKKKNPNVTTFQRFKGLGEMNPDQLEETTLNPKSRTLKQITMEDREFVLPVLDMLLGNDLDGRKEFIKTNSKKANIDL